MFTPLRYLVLPATLAHELVHAAAGSLWAERVAIVWYRSGVAKAQIDWRDDPPGWGVALTGLAPFLAGLLAGVLAVAQWFSAATPTPATPLGWGAWTIVAMWWVVFVAPSGSDLRASRASGARADDSNDSDNS